MADSKTLYVDLSILKSNVTLLRNMQRSMANIGTTLRNLSGEAGEFWDGRAFKVFKNNQKSLINKVTEMEHQIGNCRNDLEQAIAVYERTENDNTKTVENLSTKDIF